MTKSGAAFVILILSGFSAPCCRATVYHSDGSVANLQALENAAQDGDTITLPAGTFSWTTRVNISKGITLQGQTTVTGDYAHLPMTAIDSTIIQDNTPRTQGTGLIQTNLNGNQFFRVTGITFAAGSANTYPDNGGAIDIESTAIGGPTSVRIDHCHYNNVYQNSFIWTNGWIVGVVDHNLIDCQNTKDLAQVNATKYGGSTQMNGNGSWADYPWYGSNKFLFFEDNRINGNSTNMVLSGHIDAQWGGRYVTRRNYWWNAHPGGHGTEFSPVRGLRCREVYDNIFEFTVVAPPPGEQRSGSSLFHDNIFLGNLPGGGYHTGFSSYRQTDTRPSTYDWGQADGTSVWDRNDTDGNGHYVEGQPPYLFQSGTASSGTQGSGTVTMTDTSKNWTTNQWIGYSIKNTNSGSPSYTQGSFIISNTATTIVYSYGGHLSFTAGDTYEIHCLLTQFDGNCMGKGDQVVGDPHPINQTTVTPFWTHENREPCYSWNNVYAPTNAALGYTKAWPQMPTPTLGIDFFNLGAGFPADTTPAEVSRRYIASLNGVDYTGPYVYPHPLISGAPPPPPPTPMPTPRSQHLQKKWKKQAKQLKGKKGGKARETSGKKMAEPVASPP
jgi:hypothetical protein